MWNWKWFACLRQGFEKQEEKSGKRERQIQNWEEHRTFNIDHRMGKRNQAWFIDVAGDQILEVA